MHACMHAWAPVHACVPTLLARAHPHAPPPGAAAGGAEVGDQKASRVRQLEAEHAEAALEADDAERRAAAMMRAAEQEWQASARACVCVGGGHAFRGVGLGSAAQ